MAKTDYKFNRITRNDDGSMEIDSTIYEGNITTEDEPDARDVTRYRRTAVVRRIRMTSRTDISDDDLRSNTNFELATDITRDSIDQQMSPAVRNSDLTVTER